MGRPRKNFVLDETTQKSLLNAIECSLNGDGHSLSSADINILFFWARHQDDPEFDFIPEHYKLGISSKQLKESKVKQKESKESK